MTAEVPEYPGTSEVKFREGVEKGNGKNRDSDRRGTRCWTLLFSTRVD